MKIIANKNNLYKEIGVELMRNSESKWILTFDFWAYYIEIWFN